MTQDKINNLKIPLAKRLEVIREKLKKHKIDGILITKGVNYRYISGFTGSSAYLIVTQSNADLITDFRYTEQAKKQAPMFNIIEYKGNVSQEIGRLLNEHCIDSLGFESDYITYEQYINYNSKLQIEELVPIKNIVEDMRIIKDLAELDLIREAARIVDGVFVAILPLIKPGICEIEIAAEIEYRMKKFGAQDSSFQTIVASGTRSAMPHGVASNKKIENGDVITMDFGAIFEGYCSDITRTVFLGKPEGKMVKVYNTVLKSQKEALKGAHRGMKGKEVDAIAREIINSNGFENKFGHGLGHGVGLEVHEEPRFSPLAEKIIENDMVVTVEPGIYIENYGGVRIEDMIIIRDDKPEIITKAPKEMIVL